MSDVQKVHEINQSKLKRRWRKLSADQKRDVLSGWLFFDVEMVGKKMREVRK
jgi:hypothetical protein